MSYPHRWAGALFLLVLSFVTIVDVRPAIHSYAAAPGRIDNRIAQLQTAVETVPGKIVAQVLPVIGDQASLIRKDVFGEIRAIRIEVLGKDGRFVGLQNAVVARVDDSLKIIRDLRTENVGPLLTAATGTVQQFGVTAKTYNDLPASIGQELRPSWLALQPEITCRQLDGTGYGGCWHSRITGLMGEAVKVGGVFTQHFPSLVTSWDGIQTDVHGWTAKYVMPHKLTTWGKIKVGLDLTKDVGIAGLRGGVFR